MVLNTQVLRRETIYESEEKTMDYKELLQIFYTITLIALDLAGAYLISKIGARIKAGIEDEKKKQIVDEIEDAVTEAVCYTNQAFVDKLKATGKFDKDAQIKAFNTAMATALTHLTPVAQRYIQDNYESLEQYLEPKIETAVKLQKQSVY